MNLRHIKTGCLLLSLLALWGCGKKDSASSGTEKDLHVQPGAVAPESESWGYLPLQITRVHEKQQPLDQFPWHKDGGDWTFLYCQPNGDLSAKVIIGMHTKSAAKSDSPIGGWGEALLVATDPSAGAGFVETFAKAFRQPSPARYGHKPAGNVKGQIAVLGTAMARDPAGGFGGRKGTWTATKWFLADDIGETEVFFNFSVAEKRAEFSEKDEEYREGLIRQLVIGLRDGPLPERMPENDPGLTLVGPQVTNWTRIADRKASCRFTADSEALIFAETSEALSTKLYRAPVSRPDQRTSLGDFEGAASVAQFLGPSSDSPLLVHEILRKTPGVISSTDPLRLWLVSPGVKQPVSIPPNLANCFIGKNPVSPDKGFIVVQTWQKLSNKKGGRVIHLGDLKSAQWRTVSLPDRDLTFSGWLPRGPQAIVFAASDALKSDQQKAFRLDPATGQLSEMAAIPPGFGLHERLSPDGKLVARIKKNESLLLTDLKTRQDREFIFHAYDRPNVFEDSVEWVSPSLLLFEGQRAALINAETLKMNFPVSKASGVGSLQFSPDFKLAIGSKEDGLYLGKVMLPESSTASR